MVCTSSTLLQLYLVYLVAQVVGPGPGFSASHKEVSLMYFSMFELNNLTQDSIMQRAEVPMLYDTASNPLHLPCRERAGARPPHSVFHSSWR